MRFGEVRLVIKDELDLVRTASFLKTDLWRRLSVELSGRCATLLDFSWPPAAIADMSPTRPRPFHGMYVAETVEMMISSISTTPIMRPLACCSNRIALSQSAVPDV